MAELVIFIVLMLPSLYVLWIFVLKNLVTPPCVNCKHCMKISTLYFCRRVRDEVDDTPEICLIARSRCRCKFERKAGE